MTNMDILTGRKMKKKVHGKNVLYIFNETKSKETFDKL